MKNSHSLVNSKHIQLIKKVKELEAEVSAYKNIIDTLTREMENAKTKISLTMQENAICKEESQHLKNMLGDYKLETL